MHGLGGTSQQTWSRDKDPRLFWPKVWLPFEPELSQARVLSFGYNAHFAAGGSNILNISDFAKELLFGMKFGTDSQAKILGVGQVSLLYLTAELHYVDANSGAYHICCAFNGRSCGEKGLSSLYRLTDMLINMLGIHLESK